MRTKEEIVTQSYENTFKSQKYENRVNKSMDEGWILPAMDEYAKEVAVKFLNWAEEKHSGYEGLSFNRFYDEKKEPTLFIKGKETTISELYNQFIQSLNH